MSGLNLFIVGAIVVAVFAAGIWFTITEFTQIEDHETDRRKHLEKDMKVQDKSDNRE